MTTRPLAYRLGQLLAIGEIAAGREHDPALMHLARPDQMVATLAPAVVRAGGWMERRWQAAMSAMPEVPTQPLDVMGETQLALGYWHERTHINRAQRLLERRRAAGLSQSDWAQMLGVSIQSVRAWEHHVNNVPEEVERLSELVRERVSN